MLVNKPIRMRNPPMTSIQPATMAIVGSGPPPPIPGGIGGQPRIFWAPWSMNMSPLTMRSKKNVCGVKRPITSGIATPRLQNAFMSCASLSTRGSRLARFLRMRSSKGDLSETSFKPRRDRDDHDDRREHHASPDAKGLTPRMIRRLALLAGFLIFFAAPPMPADTSTYRLLLQAWPGAKAKKVREIGRGIGVVFSPDLSVKDNCRFYEALGFACFQDADWTNILTGVHTFNLLNPDRRISTLILETHGTNGNGLKVQESYEPEAQRSYISVGALQERLEADGVFYVVISACNSGRLLR